MGTGTNNAASSQSGERSQKAIATSATQVEALLGPHKIQSEQDRLVASASAPAVVDAGSPPAPDAILSSGSASRSRPPPRIHQKDEELTVVTPSGGDRATNSGPQRVVTRARMRQGIRSFIKQENIQQGDIQCPVCYHVICVADKGCNIVTCRNHQPQYVFFCVHCKKVNKTEYAICTCPKRNTRVTRAQAQTERNRLAKKSPIEIDLSSSSEGEEIDEIDEIDREVKYEKEAEELNSNDPQQNEQRVPISRPKRARKTSTYYSGTPDTGNLNSSSTETGGTFVDHAMDNPPEARMDMDDRPSSSNIGGDTISPDEATSPSKASPLKSPLSKQMIDHHSKKSPAVPSSVARSKGRADEQPESYEIGHNNSLSAASHPNEVTRNETLVGATPRPKRKRRDLYEKVEGIVKNDLPGASGNSDEILSVSEGVSTQEQSRGIPHDTLKVIVEKYIEFFLGLSLRDKEEIDSYVLEQQHQQGHLDLDKRPPYDKDDLLGIGMGPLVEAVGRGDEASVFMILQWKNWLSSCVLLDGGDENSSSSRQLENIFGLKGQEAFDEAALHYAAYHESESMCRLLLDHGAEVNTLDPLIGGITSFTRPSRTIIKDHLNIDERITPFDIAVHSGNKALISLFLTKASLRTVIHGIKFLKKGLYDELFQPLMDHLLSHQDEVLVQQTFAKYTCMLLRDIIEKGRDINTDDTEKKETDKWRISTILLLLKNQADVVETTFQFDYVVETFPYDYIFCKKEWGDQFRKQATPLHLAILARIKPAIEYIVSKDGIDVDYPMICKSSWSRRKDLSPFYLAVNELMRTMQRPSTKQDHSDALGVVQLLLQKKAKFFGTRKTALMTACCWAPDPYSGFRIVGSSFPYLHSLIKLLLDQERSAGDEYALPCAVESQMKHPIKEGMAIIQLLIDSGLNVNVQWGGKTALHCLVKYGQKRNLNLIKLLLKNGANPNIKYKYEDEEDMESDETSLHCAAREDSVGSIVVPLLLQKGADVNATDSHGRTPLLTAIFHRVRTPATVRLLLESGADVNVSDKCGCTPLMAALDYGSEKMLPLLLKFGAKIGTCNPDGCTALHLAIKWRDWASEEEAALSSKMTKVLLGVQGIERSIRSQDNSGNTPLHWACEVGNAYIVKQLLKKGPGDVANQMNRMGCNPFHHAVICGELNIVRLFLKWDESGNTLLDMPCTRIRGQTPLHLAVENIHPDIVKLLVASRANLSIKDRNGRGREALKSARMIHSIVSSSSNSKDTDLRSPAEKIVNILAKAFKRAGLDESSSTDSDDSASTNLGFFRKNGRLYNPQIPRVRTAKRS